MKDMKVQIIEQMVTNLKNMDTLYFIQYGDHTFTNIEEKKEAKRTPSPSKYPFKEVSKHIKSQLPETLWPGVCGFINSGKYDIESVRSTFTSHVTTKYGAGKVSTSVDRDKNLIWYIWETDEPIVVDNKTMNLLPETVNE